MELRDFAIRPELVRAIATTTVLICILTNESARSEENVFRGGDILVTAQETGIDDISLSKASEKYPVSPTNPFTTFSRFELDGIPFIQQTNTLNGNADFAQIRGANSFSRTTLLQNGTPLNFRSGLGSSTLLLTPESTKEVRVIRGPNSMLYGADAMGGTINYISDPAPKNALFLQSGSFGELGYGGIFSAPHSEGRTNFSLFQENIDGNYTFEKADGSVVKQDQNNTFTQRAHVWGGHKVSRGYLDYDFVSAEQTGAYPGPIDSGGGAKEYKSQLASLGYRTSLTKTLAGDFSATHISSDYGTRLFSEREYDVSKNQKTRGKVFLENNWNQTSSSALVLEADHSEFESDETFSRDSLDIATNYSFSPTDNLTLTPGVRWLTRESVAITDFRARLESDIKTEISLSEGYRPPSLTDLYLQNDFFEGNENLRPEVSRQVELSVSKNWGDQTPGFGQSVEPTLKIYHIFYRDLISTTSDGTVFTVENLGESESYGVELSSKLNYKVTSLNLSLSQSENRDLSSGTDVPVTPNTTYETQLTQAWGPLSFNLRSTTWSSYLLRGGADADRQDGFTTYDFFISSFAFRHGEYLIGVDNFTDQKREIISGYPEPQRRYYMRVKVFL